MTGIKPTVKQYLQGKPSAKPIFTDSEVITLM